MPQYDPSQYANMQTNAVENMQASNVSAAIRDATSGASAFASVGAEYASSAARSAYSGLSSAASLTYAASQTMARDLMRVRNVMSAPASSISSRFVPSASNVYNPGFMESLRASTGMFMSSPRGMLRSEYRDLASRNLSEKFSSVGEEIGIQAMELGAFALPGVGLIGGAALAAPAMIGGSYLREKSQQRSQVKNLLRQTSWRYNKGKSLAGNDIDQLGRDFVGMARGREGVGLSDMGSLAASATELGVFDTAKNTDEITRKFKGFVDKVDNLVKQLDITAEEAVQRIGSKNPSLTQQSVYKGIGLSAGLTMGELNRSGQESALMFSTMGMSPQFGYNMGVQNIASARGLQTRDAAGASLVGRMGGLGAVNNMMTQGTANFMQTTDAAVMMGAFADKSGRVDQGKLLGFITGGGTMEGLTSKFAQNLGNRSGDMAYQARLNMNLQDNLNSMGPGMVNAMKVGGLAMRAQAAVGGREWNRLDSEGRKATMLSLAPQVNLSMNEARVAIEAFDPNQTRNQIESIQRQQYRQLKLMDERANSIGGTFKKFGIDVYEGAGEGLGSAIGWTGQRAKDSWSGFGALLGIMGKNMQVNARENKFAGRFGIGAIGRGLEFLSTGIEEGGWTKEDISKDPIFMRGTRSRFFERLKSGDIDSSRMKYFQNMAEDSVVNGIQTETSIQTFTDVDMLGAGAYEEVGRRINVRGRGSYDVTGPNADAQRKAIRSIALEEARSGRAYVSSSIKGMRNRQTAADIGKATADGIVDISDKDMETHQKAYDAANGVKWSGDVAGKYGSIRTYDQYLKNDSSSYGEDLLKTDAEGKAFKTDESRITAQKKNNVLRSFHKRLVAAQAVDSSITTKSFIAMEVKNKVLDVDGEAYKFLTGNSSAKTDFYKGDGRKLMEDAKNNFYGAINDVAKSQGKDLSKEDQKAAMENYPLISKRAEAQRRMNDTSLTKDQKREAQKEYESYDKQLEGVPENVKNVVVGAMNKDSTRQALENYVDLYNSGKDTKRWNDKVGDLKWEGVGKLDWLKGSGESREKYKEVISVMQKAFNEGGRKDPSKIIEAVKGVEGGMEALGKMAQTYDIKGSAKSKDVSAQAVGKILGGFVGDGKADAGSGDVGEGTLNSKAGQALMSNTSKMLDQLLEVHKAQLKILNRM